MLFWGTRVVNSSGLIGVNGWCVVWRRPEDQC
jgi:hypothetical protein